MRNPEPFPAELVGRVFTRAQARAVGVSDGRFRARDIQRVGHGTYLHVVSGQDHGEHARAPGNIENRQWQLARALGRRSPNVWASHVTAAQVYGLALPRRLLNGARVHLTAVNHCLDAEVDPSVVLHRARALPADLAELHGARLSPPGRLFVELSRYLRFEEHVWIGDQMVRNPRYEWEGRREPLITLASLHREVENQRRRPGIVQAREALDHVRVGADSPPETRLRLALVGAGLPEPELQIPLSPSDPLSPVGDMGYRMQRLVLQYDGEHHFTAEQQQRDQWRNAQFEAAGWTVVIANRVDLRGNFRGVVARVRHLLEWTVAG